MFNTQKPIIVLLTIGNEQKTIFLEQKFDYSGIYDIIMDKECQGEVRKIGNGWSVNTFPESPIQREHYEALANAINDAIDLLIRPQSKSK